MQILTLIAALFLVPSSSANEGKAPLTRHLGNTQQLSFSAISVFENQEYQLHGIPHSERSLSVWTTDGADRDINQRFAVHIAGQTVFYGRCQDLWGQSTCSYEPHSGTLTMQNVTIEMINRDYVYSINGKMRTLIQMTYIARTTPIMTRKPPEIIWAGKSVTVTCIVKRYSPYNAIISWFVDDEFIQESDVTQIQNGKTSFIISTAILKMRSDYNNRSLSCAVDKEDGYHGVQAHSLPFLLLINGTSTGNITGIAYKNHTKLEAKANNWNQPFNSSQLVDSEFPPESIFSWENQSNFQLGARVFGKKVGNSTWYKDGIQWPKNVLVQHNISRFELSGACISADGESLCEFKKETGTLTIKRITREFAGTYQYIDGTTPHDYFKFILHVFVLSTPTITVTPPDKVKAGRLVPVVCEVQRLYPNEVYISWRIGTANVTSGLTNIFPAHDIFLATNAAIIKMKQSYDMLDLYCIARPKEYHGLDKVSQPFQLRID